MKLKTSIVVTFQLEGFHRWPEAFGKVAFLRNMHRHMFHFKCHIATDSGDGRTWEFFDVKDRLTSRAKGLLETMPSYLSCEGIAAQMFVNYMEKAPPLFKVEVWEDGENGAVVELEEEAG